ncbi:cell wall-binding repeat-containing protein [Dactylosporangium sp. NPDC005555]|uniref:cell wall-binding repeat-containing protein n=1 Tax=Dactylosporangium sp. NPDC005555 TaxID=3154889 RepID=UPI0033A545AC
MAFALTRRSAMLGAVAAATGTAMSGLIPGQRTANASLPGKTAGLTYKRGDQIWWADLDGNNARVLASGVTAGSGCWSPDGSRFVYTSDNTIFSVRADGTERVRVCGPWGFDTTEPVYTHDGANVIYTGVTATGPKLLVHNASGNVLSGAAGTELTSVAGASAAAVAADGTVVCQLGTAIYRVQSAGAVTKVLDNAAAPDFSPDSSKLAFVRDGQVWIAAADGSAATQLTTAANTSSASNTDPAWATNGLSILFTSVEGGTPKIKRIDVASKTVDLLVAKGSEPTCQPVNRNSVHRVWGQTAIGTAVATSRYNWPDRGAKAVVLSRDDTYLDALGGSALAIVKQGPLLITPPRSLDGQAKAEIQRVLAPGGTVYLLGGTVALSAAVESTLTGLGYKTVRLWGQDEYETAVAVAKAITPTPSAVIVATSLKYYDALAAGAAAGANPGTVVVLSAGATLPAATATYLNTLQAPPATRIYAAGGPAWAAMLDAKRRWLMPSWPQDPFIINVSGQDEYETAVLVAQSFFPNPRTAAVATGATWFDALTGGAMIGANGGPLLLAAVGNLPPSTQAYFSGNSATLTDGVLLGGPLALKDLLIDPLGRSIAAPGAYDYRQYTETSTGR